MINQSLRENYKMKEYTSTLSDQLLVLGERIYTAIRKQTI
jgi:hypothetical protein